MVLLHQAKQINTCKANTHFRPKEVITFDSQYHAEFRKRYKALVEEEKRPKLPIRLIIIVAVLVLCVLNVFWNLSIHHSAVKVVEIVKKNSQKAEVIATGNLNLPKLRGPMQDRPNRVHLVADPVPVGRKPRIDNVNKPPPKVPPMLPPNPQPKLKPRPKMRPSLNDVLLSEKKPRPVMPHTMEQTVPIYYVNLDRATDRREYIETHLTEQHLKAQRVSAVESLVNTTIAVVSPLSMVNPNNKEIACIASHLIAIHKAVNDQTFFPTSPYALIIEDDVRFEFPINWNELLYNAPEDFDVLQLMVSNSEQVAVMAEYYDTTVTKMIQIGIEKNISTPDKTKHDFLWSNRVRGSFLWSTQAYAIRKDNVRHIINTLVKRDDLTGEYSVTIKNTPNQVSYCKQVNGNSCKLLYPFRLVADIYLYDVLGVAYTARLPFFNGVTGYNSSIQPDHVDKASNNSFTSIGGVVSYVRKYSDELLPTGLLLV